MSTAAWLRLTLANLRATETAVPMLHEHRQRPKQTVASFREQGELSTGCAASALDQGKRAQ
jgi:hypothetical protein